LNEHPELEHVLLYVVLQAVPQLAPPVTHPVERPCGIQVLFEQQPFGQFEELHV